MREGPARRNLRTSVLGVLDEQISFLSRNCLAFRTVARGLHGVDG